MPGSPSAVGGRNSLDSGGMLLADVVATWQRVQATSSRRAKVGLLAACLRRMPAAELAIGASFLAGDLPAGRVGVGWSTLAGATPPPAAPPPGLTLTEVERELRRLGQSAGPGSRRGRGEVLNALLKRATEPEQRFLRSLIMRDLRQGALAGMVVEAVAAAAGLPAEEVRRPLMVTGNLGEVARAALQGGVEALRRFRLTLFRPLQPMLAQSVAGVDQALARLGRASLEAQVDGARIQVHRRGGLIAVYTRSLREITAWVPEVVEAVGALRVDSVILDGEAVALDRGGVPLPFQDTMARFGSRREAELRRASVPLTPLFFDCLHLDGEDLLARPEEERARALGRVTGASLLVPRVITDRPTRAAAFYRQVLAMGHEGVLAKDPAALYEAGRRGAAWLKVKPVHTLDLVVLAAEWGSGRRRGWLSNLHLGARDPDGGAFVMLGKTFKGLTDEMLEWQTRRLLLLEERREGHVVVVRPALVVEVAFDGVQASPRYPGGVTLRFARVRRYREDKAAGAADTIDTVQRLRAGRG
jgi:DNA ligase-1